MPLMTTTMLSNIADKLARFATVAVGDPEFDDAFSAGMETASAAVLSGGNSIATYLLGLLDEDVEADLLPAARDLDQTHPTPPDGFLLQIKEITAILTALDTHYKRFGYKGLDDYLTVLNAASPTLRLHGHFRRYLKKISAGNAFIPNDLDLGTMAITGAAAGTFTDGVVVDKTQYGGAKLVAKNVGALNSAPVISVVAKRRDGTSATLTATLSTATDAHETNLSDTAKLYVDVTNVTITSLGTNADSFKIMAKTDRDISAA